MYLDKVYLDYNRKMFKSPHFPLDKKLLELYGDITIFYDKDIQELIKVESCNKPITIFAYYTNNFFKKEMVYNYPIDFDIHKILRNDFDL